MVTGRGSLPPALLLVGALTTGAARDAAAQLMVGIGSAFPAGEFKTARQASTGWAASGRLGMSLLVLAIQFEASYTRMEMADLQDVGTRPLSRTAAGGNAAVHFIRVGGVRPYVLAGVFFGARRAGANGAGETSWRFGHQAGAGVDVASGPLRPFAELRYVSGDAPGRVRDTYVALLAGLRLF
jgi:hypothetical protein